MGARIPSFVLAATVAAALSAPMPVLAQADGWMKPPSDTSRAKRKDQLQNLDFLFGALKVAPDDTSAKAISDRIWNVWMGSGGDTTNLLIDRVRTAIESKDLDLALRLLDSVVEFKPEYVEGWNQRATVYYMKKDYTHALADLAQALKREPRHFGALFGFGVIMQEFGDDKRALDAYRRALEIDPHMKRVPDLVKELSVKVEGRDI
jgi:tetratricopeptide (TPR) repeat protein